LTLALCAAAANRASLREGGADAGEDALPLGAALREGEGEPSPREAEARGEGDA
jgi:hypothetical protein